jgi:hypothetical protein
MADVCVDLGAFEALLEVLVDGFVGDLAQECQIRDTDLLFLGRLEGRLLGSPTAAASGCGSALSALVFGAS